MTPAAATPAAEPAAAGAANATGVAGRLRALFSPVVPPANMQPAASRTPERARRRPPGVAAAAAAASPSSASSLEEEDATAAAAAAAGIEVSPLEGPHISLSEAAKRLASPPRPSAERSMMRPGEHFWE